MSQSIDGERRARARSPLAEDCATTQELRTRDLNAVEQRLQTRGLWMIFCGVGVAIMTLALAIVWHFGFHEDMPLAFVLPLYGASFGSISLGCIEVLTRPSRANHLRALARMEQIENGLKQLVELLPEEMRQRWYAGYVRGTQDNPWRTGTDNSSGGQQSGDVLKLHRRSERPRI